MKKLIFILVAAVAAALLSAAPYAQDYPSRPITIVAVFGPGSASDTICRIVADRLSPKLGQPVLVDDRPGADGVLASLYVRYQPADGYTLLMGTNSPLSAAPFLHKSPDVQAKFKNIGFEGFSSTPEELEEFIKAQFGKWGQMVKDAGIQAE